jgi:predicted AlkP superfamily pyrophosphatase or phosphodiesterase
LVVLLVIDQMRGDYLERWRELWLADGFHRLLEEGTNFTNCHVPYAATETGPGHATLATGQLPTNHGIIGNFWYDRGAVKEVYCVGCLGNQGPIPDDAAGEGPSTPERLIGPTIGDRLHEASNGRSRVVSISLKDRAAVLLGGHRPDACYWFDAWTGGFMTSSYYGNKPHDWVVDFNKSRSVDQWFGKDWSRFRPDLDYAVHSAVDDARGEATGWIQGRTFPHPMTGGLNRLQRKSYANRDYYGALSTSPFGNELLLNFAKKAIDAERLGQDEFPDLLCLSCSAVDAIGHSWGPDSQEMLDTMLRADALVADLLKYLDHRIGQGRYLLVLTSDHGVCPLPEAAAVRGHDSGRVSLKSLRNQANHFFQQQYPGGDDREQWIEACAENWFYLNRRLLSRRKISPADAETTLAGWFAMQPGILTSYSRTQLVGHMPPDDLIGLAVQRSFHPDRSGDVAVIFQPYYIPSDDEFGTTHGSPHAYDLHVPLLIFGTGISSESRAESVTPLSVAGILCAGLGLATPPDAKE